MIAQKYCNLPDRKLPARESSCAWTSVTLASRNPKLSVYIMWQLIILLGLLLLLIVLIILNYFSIQRIVLSSRAHLLLLQESEMKWSKVKVINLSHHNCFGHVTQKACDVTETENQLRDQLGVESKRAPKIIGLERAHQVDRKLCCKTLITATCSEATERKRKRVRKRGK